MTRMRSYGPKITAMAQAARRGGVDMNKDQLKGKLRQARGTAKQKLGKLTGNRRQHAEGEVDRTMGKVQERYGAAREQVERRIKP